MEHRESPTHSIDLATTYLGLRLHSPIVASASPVTGNPLRWELLEQSGAGAIVLPSLFEEQIEHESFAVESTMSYGSDSYGESLTYFPELEGYDAGPAHHISLVEQARERLAIPVIASVNGSTPGGWVHYARSLEDAGAHAIELNIYDVIIDPRRSAGDVEYRYLELVEAVRAVVTVPLAVKLGPWFTSLGHFALSLEEIGVNGLVLFNRLYQPDIDLDTLAVTPRLQLSNSDEARLALHWMGILRGFTSVSLAATTGVHNGADALKMLLAGADVAMTASAILQHGPQHIASMLTWIREWMIAGDYNSIEQLKGSVSQHNVPNPDAYQRSNYYQVLHSWRP